MGNRRRQRRLDLLDPIPREKEGLKAREEGKVSEGGNGGVCKVDCILVLLGNQYTELDIELKEIGKELTFAIPKFSIAGILCPTQLKHKNDINPAHFKNVVSVLFRLVCITHLGGQARDP